MGRRGEKFATGAHLGASRAPSIGRSRPIVRRSGRSCGCLGDTCGSRRVSSGRSKPTRRAPRGPRDAPIASRHVLKSDGVKKVRPGPGEVGGGGGDGDERTRRRRTAWRTVDRGQHGRRELSTLRARFERVEGTVRRRCAINARSFRKKPESGENLGKIRPIAHTRLHFRQFAKSLRQRDEANPTKNISTTRWKVKKKCSQICNCLMSPTIVFL